MTYCQHPDCRNCAIPFPGGDAYLRVKICQQIDLLGEVIQVRVRKVIGGIETECQFPARIEDLIEAPAALGRKET